MCAAIAFPLRLWKVSFHVTAYLEPLCSSATENLPPAVARTPTGLGTSAVELSAALKRLGLGCSVVSPVVAGRAEELADPRAETARPRPITAPAATTATGVLAALRICPSSPASVGRDSRRGGNTGVLSRCLRLRSPRASRA
jgi:hypothetical protein